MSKGEIRKRIWQSMEEKGIATFPRPARNRIPNFVGAEKAAQNLGDLPEYKSAKAVFCNPDLAQQPVRHMVLRDRKTLVLATPRLKQGFLLIDPTSLSNPQIREASTIRGAFKFGHLADLASVRVDLFVSGSVAVSRTGSRLGKGTGYSDQEYSMLKSAGALSSKAIVVTTIHDVQIVEGIPAEEWDVPVDVIITPAKTIRIRR